MKLALFFATSLLSLTVSAAEIRGGRYNAAQQSIDLDVSYTGGCAKHDFKLEVGACMEISPVVCSAKLLHNNNGDSCEMFVFTTISIPLKDAGLNNSYYWGAGLNIQGDNQTRALVTLPR